MLTLPKALRWVDQTIAEHRHAAVPLRSIAEFTQLDACFPMGLLEGVRIVPVASTPRPPLEAWGLRQPDEFSEFEAAGITLDQMIFVKHAEQRNASLMFHELVHAVQWRLLGRARFLTLYGLMLLEQGYHTNPLEVMAYDLQRQFDAGRLTPTTPIIQRRLQESIATFAMRSMPHRLLTWALLVRGLNNPTCEPHDTRFEG